MVVKPSFTMVVGSDLLVNVLKISIFLVFTIGNTVLHCHPGGGGGGAVEYGLSENPPPYEPKPRGLRETPKFGEKSEIIATRG